ncbi:type III secretion system export apparatus subunit SctU [Achromobacter marplatensis]|uniref:type III secretion system export apparatus subunit SctU n=1 Tax=Achromobacter marplatensis TaxID=470868 RepID=UPI0039F6E935
MSGEKTEPPSQKRLRDSRKKGEVAHSKDFTQTVLILAMFGYMIGNAEAIVESFARIILIPANFTNVPFEAAINTVFDLLLQEMLAVLLPFLGIAIGVGIFAEVLQVGLVLAFKKLLPSAKKLNVISNLKNIFSKKNLVEFIKSIVKIVFLTILVVQVIRDEMPELMAIPHSGLAGMAAAMGSMMRTLVVNIAVAYFIISVVDLGWQRMQYRKGLMMSKEEVKQEYKEMEGDPHIKHARKHLHQEMAMNGAVANTRKASVVVTNPTHLAIALYYEEDEVPLPVILAKGEGALAAAMVKAAREEGIPVMQNIPLARALMAQGQIDQYIPAELIVPTAELLRLLRASLDQGISNHG